MTTTETFGNYLRRKFHEWRGKKLPDNPSQADWAVYLGVPTSNLSTWMSDQKKPTAEYLDKLADKLGIEVYLIAGVAPRMPNDKKLSFIATVWRLLPDDMKEEWFRQAQSIKAEREGNGESKKPA